MRKYRRFMKLVDKFEAFVAYVFGGLTASTSVLVMIALFTNQTLVIDVKTICTYIFLTAFAAVLLKIK